MNEERRDEKEDLEPIKFDYLDEGNSNQLVTGTRQIFKDADIFNLLNKSVKTNFYYFATKNVNELHQIWGINKFEDNAFKWTRQIIEMLNPKIIICEGNDAFNKVKDMYNDDFDKKDEITPKRYGEIGDIQYYELEGKPLVIGYYRTYSTISNINKELLTSFLKEEIEKRNLKKE